MCMRKKKRRRSLANQLALAGSEHHPSRLRRVSIGDEDLVPVELDRARVLHEFEDRLKHGRLYLRLALGLNGASFSVVVAEAR